MKTLMMKSVLLFAVAATISLSNVRGDEPASLAAIYELTDPAKYQAAEVASLSPIYDACPDKFAAGDDACDCLKSGECDCKDCICERKFTRTIAKPTMRLSPEAQARHDRRLAKIDAEDDRDKPLPFDDPPPRPSTRKTQWQIVTAPGLADGTPEIQAALKDWKLDSSPDAHFRKRCAIEDPDAIKRYHVKKLPAYILTYDGNEIERKEGEFPGWKYLTDRYIAVATGKASVQPAASQSASADYPLRGNLWSHPGGGKAGLINHLMTGQHAGKFSRTYLESLDLAELESLHSDDHDGRVKMRATSSVAVTRREPIYQQQTICDGRGSCRTIQVLIGYRDAN